MPYNSLISRPFVSPVGGLMMSRLATLALLCALGTALPALAQMGDELDSTHQTEGYGRMFAFVGGAIAALVMILVAYHVIKGMIAESQRGKKTGWLIEETLEDLPKKDVGPERYLGEKVPDWKIANRTAATLAALKYLSATDKMFKTKNMSSVAEEGFRLIKAAIEKRTTKKVEACVSPKCLEELKEEVRKLGKRKEQRLFGKIEVLGIEIVHVEAPASKKNHTFTALISARSRDFIMSDAGKLLRGDKKVYTYQEFWRFRRSGGGWIVDRIRPSGDMDRVLEAKNVLAAADLQQFAQETDEVHLREFVAK